MYQITCYTMPKDCKSSLMFRSGTEIAELKGTAKNGMEVVMEIMAEGDPVVTFHGETYNDPVNYSENLRRAILCGSGDVEVNKGNRFTLFYGLGGKEGLQGKIPWVFKPGSDSVTGLYQQMTQEAEELSQGREANIGVAAGWDKEFFDKYNKPSPRPQESTVPMFTNKDKAVAIAALHLPKDAGWDEIYAAVRDQKYETAGEFTSNDIPELCIPDAEPGIPF